MFPSQSHLSKLFYSFILFSLFLNGSEEPSQWERRNNQVADNLPSSQSAESEAPSFQLEKYENIINQLSETKIEQLFKEAPAPLKRRKATLIKHTTGPSSSRKILFEGPSGSGKTSLALAIAYKCKTPYIFIPGSRIVNSSFKNCAPKCIDALFKALRTDQRSTLIIDEFTAFTAKLNHHNDGDVGSVHDFWIALDQHIARHELIFIATTNEVDKVPAALLDRFGDRHHIGNPSNALRTLILKASPLILTYKYDLEKLVTETDGFSLRDLELLYREAIDFANERDPDTKENTPLTHKDIDNALQYVREASHIKAKDNAEKANYQKWENFNRYQLPLIGLGIGTGVTIIGMIISHRMNKEHNIQTLAIQDTHHKDNLALQEQHHQDSINLQKLHHEEQIKQNKKFHEDNIQLQKTQFQEQIYNQTKNTLLQGVATAAANVPIVNTVLTETVCEGVDFTVDLAVRSIIILNPLPFPIGTRTFIKPIIRPFVQFAIPYVIAFSPQWGPLVIKSENKPTTDKNAK